MQSSPAREEETATKHRIRRSIPSGRPQELRTSDLGRVEGVSFADGRNRTSTMTVAASSGKRKPPEGRNVLMNELVYKYERYRRRRRKKVHKRDTDDGSGDGGAGQQVVVISEQGLAEPDKNEHIQKLQQ